MCSLMGLRDGIEGVDLLSHRCVVVVKSQQLWRVVMSVALAQTPSNSPVFTRRRFDVLLGGHHQSSQWFGIERCCLQNLIPSSVTHRHKQRLNNER
jgi:hypothetical protein